jgi:hypothetical protein
MQVVVPPDRAERRLRQSRFLPALAHQCLVARELDIRAYAAHAQLHRELRHGLQQELGKREHDVRLQCMRDFGNARETVVWPQPTEIVQRGAMLAQNREVVGGRLADDAGMHVAAARDFREKVIERRPSRRIDVEDLLGHCYGMSRAKRMRFGNPAGRPYGRPVGAYLRITQNRSS